MTSAVPVMIKGPHPREKPALKYMRDNPQGNRCSRCGETVAVAPDTEACVCARCLNLLLELRNAGYFDQEVKAKARRLRVDCNECGRPLPPGRNCGMCDGCRRRRNRETARERKRKQRHSAA